MKKISYNMLIIPKYLKVKTQFVQGKKNITSSENELCNGFGHLN